MDSDELPTGDLPESSSDDPSSSAYPNAEEEHPYVPSDEDEVTSVPPPSDATSSIAGSIPSPTETGRLDDDIESLSWEELLKAIKQKDIQQVRNLLNSQQWDVTRRHVNLLNFSIEYSDVAVLAAVMGVEYPIGAEGKVIIAEEMFHLLNRESPSVGNIPMTPLMTASYKGKLECLKLLISSGANVYYRTERTSEMAVDFSLEQDDPEVTLHLFENDSLFPNLGLPGRRAKFDSFKELCTPLNELVQDRERIHDLLKNRKFDSSIQQTLDKKGKNAKYFVNSQGKPALFTAAVSKNYEGWAFLTAKGMDCLTEEEISRVEKSLGSNRDLFVRELEKYFYTAKECHVVKMASRNLTFGGNSKPHKFGKKIEGFFKYLDEEDSTSILLQVLQDHDGLEIVFATDLESLKNILPFKCSGTTYGLMDPTRNRVYVSAMESNVQSYEDLVSTLAHELAHMAMAVVFQNGGLPYRTGEVSRSEEYESIVRKTSNQLGKCDKIIRRVYGYSKDTWEHELVVRVPEMIAKYKGQKPNGVDRLNQQTPELLQFYEHKVMPEFKEYVAKVLTKNRIRNGDLIRYEKILCNYRDENVQIGKCKEIEYCSHNNMKVMWVSSLKLGHSHLKANFEKDGKKVVFVDWSQFLKCKEFFISRLKKGDIEYLAVMWDADEDPKFCENESCFTYECPANHFYTMTNLVVMVTDREPPNLREGKSRIDYAWCELSEVTKESVLEFRFNLQGTKIPLKDIFAESNSEQEKSTYVEQNLEANDIGHILKGNPIHIGQPLGVSDEEKDSGTLSNNENHFISRSLSMKCVKLSNNLINRNLDCTFLISGIQESDLARTDIVVEFVTAWKQGVLGDPSLAEKRCFLIDLGSDEYEVFDETVTFYRFSDRGVNRVYLLKYCSGYYSVAASATIKEERDTLKNIVEIVTFSNAVDELFIGPLKSVQTAVEYQASPPFVLADDPGSGKSFYFEMLAMEMKRRKPTAWVVFLDLKTHASGENLSKFKRIESEDLGQSLALLAEMACPSERPIERRLFDAYCRTKNTVFLFLDGFDEICPDFRGEITSFVRSLKKNPNINLFLSTRLHELDHIVRALNGVSCSLVPFEERERVQLLDEQWNDMLKKLSPDEKDEKLKNLKSELEFHFDEGIRSRKKHATDERMSLLLERNDENNYIDLKAVAKGTLSRKIFSEGRGGILIENPLHLKMVGKVVFEGVFCVGNEWTLASLYQTVYESQMKYYNDRKVQAKGTVPEIKARDMLAEVHVKILEKLACNVMIGREMHKLPPKTLQFAVDIGLVTHLSRGDGKFQFVHRTFAEFFFARWLVKKANKVDVTNFWLGKLFLEKGMSRVREFVEGILRERDERGLAFKIEIPKLTCSSKEELSGPQKKEMQWFLCGIIHSCKPECLRFVVDSFGEIVPTVCFKEFQTVRWVRHLRSDVLSMLKEPQSEGQLIENAFHFAIKCFEELESFPKEEFIPLISKLLSTVDRHGARNMNRFLSRRGLIGLFPWNIREIEDDLTTFSKIIVDFLNGKQKEMFRYSVRRQLLHPEKHMWRRIRNDGSLAKFSIFPTLAEGFLCGSERLNLMLENVWFLNEWFEFVMEAPTNLIKHVWNAVKRALEEKDRISQFFKREDSLKRNVLLIAVQNDNPDVSIYVWDVAKETLGVEESKQWMVEAFKRFHSSGLEHVPYFSSIFDFLDHLLKDGLLDVEEASHLLLLEDSKKRRRYLRWFNDFNPLDRVLSFFRLLRHFSKDAARKLYAATKFKYSELKRNYQHRVQPHTIPFLEEEFDRIASQPSFNQFNLIPEEHVEEMKTEHSSELDLKAQTVILHNFLQLDGECLGRESLKRRLSGPGFSKSGHFPNITHLIIDTCFPCVGGVCPPIAVSYFSSVLLMFLSKKDFEGFLYEKDEDGNTVFHKMAMPFHGTLEVWKYFYDAARCVSGFEALTKVHSPTSKWGISVFEHVVMRKFDY